MSRRRCVVIALTLVTISGGMVRYATAQAPASDLIAAARKDIDALNIDSATAFLHQALDPRAGATTAERVRALVLLAATELIASRPDGARRFFREALALDPELKVDSLASLHTFLLTTFDAERLAVDSSKRESPDIPFEVEVDLPLDTVVTGSGGYRISYSPSQQADVRLSIAPTNAPSLPVWTGSQTVDSVGANWWPARYAGDGTRVPAGRYLLRITAMDSSGDSVTTERILVVALMPDTQPLPPPLDSTAFAPESLTVSGSSRGGWFGAISLSIAGVVAAGPGGVLLGFPVGLMVGGLFGHHSVAIPDNIAGNETARFKDREMRDSIRASNARAEADPPARIWVEGRIR